MSITPSKQTSVSGACPGGGGHGACPPPPLEIEKQKKKKGHQSKF